MKAEWKNALEWYIAHYEALGVKNSLSLKKPTGNVVPDENARLHLTPRV